MKEIHPTPIRLTMIRKLNPLLLIAGLGLGLVVGVGVKEIAVGNQHLTVELISQPGVEGPSTIGETAGLGNSGKPNITGEESAFGDKPTTRVLPSGPCSCSSVSSSYLDRNNANLFLDVSIQFVNSNEERYLDDSRKRSMPSPAEEVFQESNLTAAQQQGCKYYFDNGRTVQDVVISASQNNPGSIRFVDVHASVNKQITIDIPVRNIEDVIHCYAVQQDSKCGCFSRS